jgi:hypothetical protein
MDTRRDEDEGEEAADDEAETCATPRILALSRSGNSSSATLRRAPSDALLATIQTAPGGPASAAPSFTVPSGSSASAAAPLLRLNSGGGAGGGGYGDEDADGGAGGTGARGVSDAEADGATAAEQLFDADPLGFGDAAGDPLDCVGLPPSVEAWDDFEDDDDDDEEEDDEGDGSSGRPGRRTGAGVGGSGGFGPSRLVGRIRDAFSLLRPGGGGASSGSAAHSPEGDVTLVTFGAPRVGNAAWAAIANRRVQRAFRIVGDGDLVTNIPGFFFYRHSGTEVWVDQAGNTIVAPTFVEKQFRASARTSVVAHRMSAYRRALVFARRNEGLVQFRAWAAASLRRFTAADGDEAEV